MSDETRQALPDQGACPHCGHAANLHSAAREDDYACTIAKCHCPGWMPSERSNDIEAVLGKPHTAEDWVEAADYWLKSPLGAALPEASPMFKALVDVLGECKRRGDDKDRLRAEVEALREELGYRPSDTNGYCEACGCYMPKTLDGTKRVHGCDRTPPLGNLPPTIYACPKCGGHAPFAAGCWGTRDRPHEHIFMRPVHELVATLNAPRSSDEFDHPKESA